MQKRFWGLYISFIFIITVLLSALPGHNGDMPFYIACMIEKDTGEKDPFEATKAVLKAELPPDEYEVHAHRVDRAMPGILDFYRIKPLYSLVALWFQKLGFSYVFATLLPSLISYFCIGLFTFAWASKTLNALPALAVSILLMLTNSAMILPRLSTPDGVSNLILLFCLFNIYFNKNKYLTCGLLLLSIGFRLDNLVSVLVILTGMKFLPAASARSRINFVEYFGLAALAIGTAYLMNHFLVSDEYWFKNVTYTKTWKEYGMQALLYFRVFTASYFMGLIIFLAIVHFYFPFRWKELPGYMLLLMAAVVIARFVLFPSLEERFMTAYYIAGTLLIAERFSFRAKLATS